MKVSVVIPTYNRRSSLERCLESLGRQNFPRTEYEVIVVADGCTDDTVEFLRSWTSPLTLRWFAQANQGAAAAQNAGVMEARGEIVIFIDDDLICEPGVIAAHDEAHAGGERIVGLGADFIHPDSPPGSLTEIKHEQAAREIRRMSAGDIRDTDLMLYANTSIRRRDALECPFDASFARIHDVEAGQRLLAKGFRPRFVPKAVVYELFTKDVKGVLRDSRLQGKFEVILFQRFPRFRALAGIARINEGNVLKRFVRKQLALHPVLSEFILRPAFAIAEALRAQPTFASLARRILKARAANQHLSGAIREAGSWRSIEEQFGKRVPVLLYHNAGVPKPGEYPGLTTPAEEFERQIQFLVRMGYEGIRPAEWLRWRDEGEELPRRPIMLVFDDAYEEAARIAFPIIEKHGFGAACMVVTGCVGATNRWDEMAGRPSFPLMPRDQIVGWSRRGIEFGGHTRNHPYLPDEPAERVRQEIAECRDDLTELLGQAPTSFAYPFGGVSAAAETAAREHFAIAFTVWPGVLTLASNPHVVPRIEFLTGESRLGMWCRLRLGKNPMEVARNRWRKLLGERRGRSVPTGGWAKSSIERVQDGHDLSR